MLFILETLDCRDCQQSRELMIGIKFYWIYHYFIAICWRHFFLAYLVPRVQSIFILWTIDVVHIIRKMQHAHAINFDYNFFFRLDLARTINFNVLILKQLYN